MLGVISGPSTQAQDPKAIAREQLIAAAAKAGIVVARKTAGVGEAGPFVSLPNAKPVASSVGLPSSSSSSSSASLWRLTAVVIKRFAPKEATTGYKSVALRLWDGQSGVCESSAKSENVFLLVLVGAAYERWFSHLLPKTVVVIGPASGSPEVSLLPGANNSEFASQSQSPGMKIVVNGPADICTLGLAENIVPCGAKVGRSGNNDSLCEIMINKLRSPACSRHLLAASKTIMNSSSSAPSKGSGKSSAASVPTPLSKVAAAVATATAKTAGGSKISKLVMTENQLEDRIRQQNQLAIMSVRRNLTTNRVIAPELLTTREQQELRMKEQEQHFQQSQRKVERHDFVDPLKVFSSSSSPSAPSFSSTSTTAAANNGTNHGNVQKSFTVRPGSLVARTLEAAAVVSAQARRREREEDSVSASTLTLQEHQKQQQRLVGGLPMSSSAVAPQQRVFSHMPDITAAATSLRTASNTTSGLAASLGLTGNYREQAREACSKNDDLAQQAAVEQRIAKLKHIEAKIDVFSALDSISEIPTTAWFCQACNRLTFNKHPFCIEKGHHVELRKTVKRFYRCGKCHNGRMPALGEAPPIGVPCLKCGQSYWERVSAAGGPDGSTNFSKENVATATVAGAPAAAPPPPPSLKKPPPPPSFGAKKFLGSHT